MIEKFQLVLSKDFQLSGETVFFRILIIRTNEIQSSLFSIDLKLFWMYWCLDVAQTFDRYFFSEVYQ